MLERTDEGDIDAAWCEGPALGRPAQAVLEDPLVELVLRILGEAQIQVRDALQDVVVVLRRAEDRWRRVGDVPAHADISATSSHRIARARTLAYAGRTRMQGGGSIPTDKTDSPCSVYVQCAVEADERVTHLCAEARPRQSYISAELSAAIHSRVRLLLETQSEPAITPRPQRTKEVVNLRTRERGETGGRVRPTLTALGRRREEADLDLLLAQLVRELDDRVPRALAYRPAVLVEVVDEVDLATRVDRDLVARADAQARVVPRAKVHDALARGRVRLLVDGARDGELVLRVDRELGAVLQLRGVVVHRGRLAARRHVRARRGRDTVLDVRTRDGVGVVRLDVEHDGHNVHVEPQARAQVRRLCADSQPGGGGNRSRVHAPP